MLTYVALFPGFFATLYLLYQMQTSSARQAAANAFALVYLPILLLLPQTFVAETPGLPDLSFSQSAIIPIFLIALFYSSKNLVATFKEICALDVLVFSFVGVCVFSEYINTGIEKYALEGNLWVTLLARNVVNIIIPYLLSKSLIHSKGFTTKAAKVLVTCTLINLFLCAYEWRFTVNLHYHLAGRFFPSQWSEIPNPAYRYGWVRIIGPFDHPILFAIMIAVSLLANYWLTKNRLWKNRLFLFSISSRIKGYILGIALSAGLILTFSRGPLLSVLVAGIFLSLGYKKHRYISLLLRLITLTLTLIIFYNIYLTYTGVPEYLAESPLGANVIYRIKLIERYWKYIVQNPWLGWGSITWPKAVGLPSIDNQYLFIQMKHGFFALALLATILFTTCLRLFLRGMGTKLHNPSDRGLAFGLFCMIFTVSISLITVYMGAQIEPLLFIIVGWAQGFLSSSAPQKIVQKTKAQPDFLTTSTVHI